MWFIHCLGQLWQWIFKCNRSLCHGHVKTLKGIQFMVGTKCCVLTLCITTTHHFLNACYRVFWYTLFVLADWADGFLSCSADANLGFLCMFLSNFCKSVSELFAWSVSLQTKQQFFNNGKVWHTSQACTHFGMFNFTAVPSTDAVTNILFWTAFTTSAADYKNKHMTPIVIMLGKHHVTNTNTNSPLCKCVMFVLI